MQSVASNQSPVLDVSCASFNARSLLPVLVRTPTGHADGRVVRWAVSPGHVAVYEHQWLAHQLGKVTALAVSPWGDLWTAAASGSVRVWSYAAQQQQPGLGQGAAGWGANSMMYAVECCGARRSSTRSRGQVGG